jgi:hypothetical protein
MDGMDEMKYPARRNLYSSQIYFSLDFSWHGWHGHQTTSDLAGPAWLIDVVNRREKGNGIFFWHAQSKAQFPLSTL